jgi:O-antigen/teichoic acid export membrane protein
MIDVTGALSKATLITRKANVVHASIVAKLSKLKKATGRGRQAYWATLAQVVAGAAAFVTSVIIIRQVGLEEFGRFSVAALLVIIVKNFAEGLVLAPLASIGPKLNQFAIIPYRGFALSKAIVFFAFTSALILVAMVAAGVISGAAWLCTLAMPVAFASSSSGLSDFFRRQQFLIGAPVRSFILEAVRYSVQLALLLLLASFAPDELSAKSAINLTALSALCSTVLGYFFYGAWTIRLKMMRAAWFRHWNFIRWMVPSVALETVQAMFPFIYATAILGEAALGLVRAAQQITSLLNLPFNALLQVIPAFAAARMAQHGAEAARKFLAKIGKIMALATAATGMIVLLLSDQISLMLDIVETSEFGLLMLLFMTVNVLNALRFSTMVFVNTLEQTWINLAASAAGALASIFVTITLTAHYGAKTVPFAFIAVAALNWLTLYVWYKMSHPAKRKIFAKDTELLDE